ncbi:unnamed protein product [Eruca vesicaria subsp. sativa]|uniref:Uncharacterized protein n=1 Tax=Eruca vesicaria subsp. sativa TaxID=29727 RepID=A0ABC8JHW8_ERUVS|nr:unnamed protein product [Eruca vesicaria subsp. sativa]
MDNGANRRRTRRSGSGLEQTNGGEVVTPAPENVSQQSNASVPLKTPEADSHMKDLKESTNDVNVKGIANGVSGEEQQARTPVTIKKSSKTKFSGSHRELVLGLPCRGQFEINRSSKKLGVGVKKDVLVSSHKRAPKDSAAAAAASSSVHANPPPVNGSKKNKYVKKVEVIEDDEYTRIKKKLRYFLNRINYEQNLIDAYSLEGWKGSSAEKLRPEKELERAKKEILRRKVKIRELIQHLDTLCAQGNIPETLFNSDGEISSEDIFCSKCGSKDVHLDNDIILCDGFCDRGFHQYCVQPPLRKEDIPPDDESWLCPGCACKDYTFDFLNDSLGTKLSVSDSWEKVFPEAAAAMAGGGGQNLDCDLPSDDSEDEEYDPDGLNDNADDEDGSDDSDESENENGSSDESASDEMIGSFKDAKDIMNLPSDDSEDDDYDPDAPTRDEDKMQESSNSDNSDSEDAETSSKGGESDEQDEVTPRVKPGRKKSKLADVSISESDAGIDDDGLVAVPGRRKVERLDYKKLYDEEYENAPTSSSDDEDWDKIAGKEDSESGDEDEETVPLKRPSKAEDHTSTQKPTQRPKIENKKATLIAPQEAPRENGVSGGKSSSASSKQTNPKTQRLFESFNENRYPDISTRENLAKELQMTVKQVSSWFNNTRFSTSKRMLSKEGVEKLRTGIEREGETSVAGSSKQTEPVTENPSGASESTSTGSRKRRRRDDSASDEMIGSFKDAKDIMNLPSDDSEDDDYDPDSPTRDEDEMQESSNSDNTSDSEDVETSSKGDESDHQDEVMLRGKLGRKKSELPDVSISESDAGIGDDSLVDVPGRRKVERLDYKKLYDAEYENVPTSSSDDEDWDKIAGKEDSESADEGDTVPLKQPSKAEGHTSTQKPSQRPKREYKKATLIAPQETPRENGCSGGKSSSASSKDSKQKNPKTKRLFESFQENRYPDISTRENLAKELQMTVKQVSSWFNNTRFSTSKTMSSKEDVEKLRTGEEREGETSLAGSSKQAMVTEPVAGNQSGASESVSTGSRKRSRR